ncbi:MAG: hypothetical protein HPY74_01575 [Firmicutes bacterium]|nr:hypothetical protein [Bacillota bacterium]
MKSIYLGLDKDYISIYDAAGNLVASNKFRQKTSLDPENIEFKWNIDEKILDYKTVKLILQPVIENSIYHGVNKVERHGVIEISCIDAGENIEYRVKDNGAGISEDALQLLRKSLSEPGLGNRIGIYNVQSRLRLYFGKRFGLAIQSKKGEGTEVTITIPKIPDTLTG